MVSAPRPHDARQRLCARALDTGCIRSAARSSSTSRPDCRSRVTGRQTRGSAGSRHSATASNSGPMLDTSISRRKTSTGGASIRPSRTRPATSSTAPASRCARSAGRRHGWTSARRSAISGRESNRGADSGVPSIEEIFTDIDAPGLAGGPRYLHTTFFAEVDRRDMPGNPGSGGFYRASFGVWDDHNLDLYDHRRFDAFAVQHVPLNAGKTHVLSGRIGTALREQRDRPARAVLFPRLRRRRRHDPQLRRVPVQGRERALARRGIPLAVPQVRAAS